jgi:hypothetical protein
MAIRDYLIPALKREFVGREIAFGEPPQPIATFPACQENVGGVTIYDDGDEATVCIEKITHGHFNRYDETLKGEEKAKVIAEDVVGFLKALFSDRVLLQTNPDNGVGGWRILDLEKAPSDLSSSYRYFLWSKPYKV